MNWVLVFVGGGIGSCLRYSLSLLLPVSNFPWATFAVNALASLAAGFIAGSLLTGSPSNDHLRLLLLVGFCGGFSTFSAFSHENYLLLQQQQYLLFATNVLLQVIVCLAAVATGLYLSRIGA